MRTNRLSTTLVLLAFVLAQIGSGSGGAAEPRAETIAVITDMQGKATLGAASDPRDVTILSEIQAGSELELAPGSRLVVVWLRSGEEFSFSGPAAVRFTESGPRVLSGAQPTRRPSAIERAKDIRIRPSGVTQAAVVMRSLGKSPRIRLLSLAGTNTLEPNPEFRWQPIPGVRQYRFELADASGRALLELDIGADSYRLPAAITLDENVRYTWEVSARLPDGRKYAASADFMLLPAPERDRVESIRPGADATLAERVAFAMWLEQQKLRDEARKYWKDAAAERPQDTKLKGLAEE